MDQEKLKLFIVTHKQVNEVPNDRVIIGVGPNASAIKVQYNDSVGDNISEKNSTYCELTALYWIWKNQVCEFIGLEHYRRFFYNNKNFFNARPLKKEEILEILKIKKIILPKPHKCQSTVYEDYAKNHDIQDLLLCRTVIEQIYPKFINAFDIIMNSRYYSLANMFVMPKVFLDEYCEWLFRILFNIEALVDFSNKDVYQSRVFGFLAERLFNVWLYYKNFDVYYAPVFDINERPFKVRLINKLKDIFKK